MAIYHCTIKTGGRAAGKSAVAAAAYRSGEKLTDMETGIESDYTRKSGVVHSEVSLCENAPVRTHSLISQTFYMFSDSFNLLISIEFLWQGYFNFSP